MKKIQLYNHFHYGDVFFSRIIVKELYDFFEIDYYHNLNTPLFPDFENVNEIRGIPPNFDVQQGDLKNYKVNTWIGQKNFSYLNKEKRGCCFENYMILVHEILDYFKIEKKEKEEYLPTINFNKVSNTPNIERDLIRFKKIFSKLILISNGNVHSGQSLNFNFDDIILKLSTKFPNYLFLVTEKIRFKSENIICTSDITKIHPDLLQISFISKFCDVVIGRSSGPHSFCMIKDNLFDETKTFISFNNLKDESHYYFDSLCKKIWSNNYDQNNVMETIIKNI